MEAVPNNDGSPAPRAERGVWLGITLVLALSNGLAASYASPFHLLHASDSTQYHLLVRNRLRGHYEVGDGAHTVRTEGSHPVWRPGLVWIEEALARRVGSVLVSAAIAAAVGTTLLELLTLSLARACFGWAAAAVALLFMVVPSPSTNNYLLMAIGLGAEPWAGAALIGGLGVLVVGLRRRSWPTVALAGLVAGLAECFRTGNHLLFAVPCACYGVAALCRRDLRGVFLPALSGAAFVGMIALSGRMVPSDVDKTTMNLWHRQLEFYGEKIPNIDGGPISLHLGGLVMAKDAAEDLYDYAVPRSKGVKAIDYFLQHRDRIIPIYLHGLEEIVAQGASGLRSMIGNLVAALFALQLLSSLFIRSDASTDALAIGGGVLAHYLIPGALLRGDEPTHYLFVAISFFVVVASGGAVRLCRGAWTMLRSRQPAWASRLETARVFLLALGLAPVICLTVIYYLGTLNTLRDDHAQARAEQATLDQLPLAGKRICCRNMNWFLDRDVVTAFFPYCDVAELERYVRGQRLDGLLLWENERQWMFKITPYGSLESFEKALQDSRLFGQPEVSGAWRWYPLKPETPANPLSR